MSEIYSAISEINWFEPIQVVFLPIVLAILAPWIAKRWQDKQKELEIKTGFVSEISDAVMKTVMTIDLATNQSNDSQRKVTPDNINEELYDAYKEWEVTRCIIGSKIHAYFPKILEKWETFSKRVTKYYECKWDGEKVTEECVFALEKERREMLQEKADIISEILDTKIIGFR